MQFPLRVPRVLRFLVVFVAAFFVTAPASAHPVPFTYLDLRLGSDAIEGTLVAHIFDLGHDLKIDPAERLLDPAIATPYAAAIANLFNGRLIVSADGGALTPQWSQVEVVADRQSLRLHVRYPLDATPGIVTISASLFPYDPYHQTFLNMYEGTALTQAILDSGRARFDYYAGTRQGALAVARRFFPLGVQHILAGPDHLLFLAGLLLLGGTARTLIGLVAAFTLAHTVTLTLASLSIIIPAARLIDPAIALSIVYLGADNLLIRGGRDVRIWIACAFGGIHGFGFAGMLREMDLPMRALGWSLFSFTAGAAVAQLVVGAVIASSFAALRSRSETLGRRLAFAGSVVVMAAGTFWFVQRVFFPSGT
ncbi:MAG: HupE/UreJ family protein [Acidobacteria bacterium]|nr:HupE/UreJ family protein [Acidobacteriota bacterium]